MSKQWRNAFLFLWAFGVCLPAAMDVRAEAELPPSATVLDRDLILYSWPYPVISPDGEKVAYVSRGYVCVASVAGEEVRRLLEVRDTWTYFLALPENAYADGDFSALARSASRDEYNAMLGKIKNTIYSLQWTAQSDGVAFGVESYDEPRTHTRFVVLLAPIDGERKKLASAQHENTSRGFSGDFILSRDGRHLVATNLGRRPLIWDVAANKPRATPYLRLTPSTISNRWLAIEKDTREVVVLDEDFAVIKRTNEFRPSLSYGLRMEWSPDENFAILRNQIGFDYHSNWEGFRLNLSTGEKLPLEGRFIDEQMIFTGRGGEFIRCGQSGVQTRGYDQVAGARLTIYPTDAGEPKDVWRMTAKGDQRFDRALWFAPGRQAMFADPAFERFALALANAPGLRPRGHWRLLDREGAMWRFPGEDRDAYVSPYTVVGFAQKGRLIVAHDEKRLFTLPVSSVATAENAEKK